MVRSYDKKVSNRYARWLNVIEKVGNRLPHPITLFAVFSVMIVLISAILEKAGVAATGELISGNGMEETTVMVRSMLTREGIQYIFTEAVDNFTSYAPLGMTLVAILGVGVAEQSGLIGVLLKSVVKITPARFITFMVVFLGVMSNVATDAGYVILIPLGALVFQAYGRHPLAGMAAAFAGVSGGFSANLVIGALDALLAGISQTAASIINPNYQVAVMGNYFFMVASTFLITILGTFVTDKIVEPRLSASDESMMRLEDDTLTRITPEEMRGLWKAGIAVLICLGGIIVACIPSNSFFRNEGGELLGRLSSPLLDSAIILISVLFFVPGIVYGKTVGSLKGEKEICGALSNAMASMGSFLALAFVAAQFINYFNYTRIGTVVALAGAGIFKKINMGVIPIAIIFIVFSAIMNLFMGSSSAKWNILAPVFVPMFMVLGYSPELCQLVYRIGDSCTNVITPMMSYYAVILAFAQRYDKNAGIGTLTAMMLPYSIIFLVGWTLLLIIWLLLGLPIGVGTSIFIS